MARTHEDGWNTRRTRIDERPQNSPATQAGMRGIHRGMRGEVIGGYTADGVARGTKSGKPTWPDPSGRGGNALGGGLGRWEALNPNAAVAGDGRPTPAAPAPSMAAPATPPVTATPSPVSPAAAPAPSPAPGTSAKPAWKEPRINPLTGLRFGTRAGDANYDAGWHDKYLQSRGIASAAAKPAPAKPERPSGKLRDFMKAAMPKPPVPSPVPVPRAPNPFPQSPAAPVASSPMVSIGAPPAKPAPAGKWQDFQKAASPAPRVPSPVPVPSVNPFPSKPAEPAAKPATEWKKPKYNVRFDPEKELAGTAKANFESKVKYGKEKRAEIDAKHAAEREARQKREDEANAAITVPDWQQTNLLGKWNRKLQRFGNRFTR